MDYSSAPNIETTLLGLTLTKVDNQDDNEVVIATADRSFRLYHDQDCCECVRVEDITGNLSDLIGSPLTEVREVIESGEGRGDDHYTRTTFHFATAKGSASICWLGTSNGYYSESVSFSEVK